MWRGVCFGRDAPSQRRQFMLPGGETSGGAAPKRPAAADPDCSSKLQRTGDNGERPPPPRQLSAAADISAGLGARKQVPAAAPDLKPPLKTISMKLGNVSIALYSHGN